MKLALLSEKEITVSTIEFELKRPNYTYQTLIEISKVCFVFVSNARCPLFKQKEGKEVFYNNPYVKLNWTSFQ